MLLLNNNQLWGGMSNTALHQASSLHHVFDYFPITVPYINYYK